MMGFIVNLSHHNERNSSGLIHPSLPDLGADLAKWQVKVLGKLVVSDMGDPAAKLRRPDVTENSSMTHHMA